MLHLHVIMIAQIIALQSHDDDLFLYESLILLLYDHCDSPSITVMQTVLVQGCIPLFLVSILTPTF